MMTNDAVIDLVPSDCESSHGVVAPPPVKKRKTASSSRIPKATVKAAMSKTKGPSKTKARRPDVGTCVCAIDVGLKNLAICILQQQGDTETGELVRPKIRKWRNTNLYEDRQDGKIIKFEAADKLIVRIRDHLDDVGRSLSDWRDVSEVGIESQAASTNAIRRAESFIFAYFVYKHPHIQVKTVSASYKLKLKDMTHTKDETASYAQRKKMSIKYGREFMSRAPPDCPYKHFAEPPARKKKGEIRETSVSKTDDYCDGLLMALHMLGLPITI